MPRRPVPKRPVPNRPVPKRADEPGRMPLPGLYPRLPGRMVAAVVVAPLVERPQYRSYKARSSATQHTKPACVNLLVRNLGAIRDFLMIRCWTPNHQTLAAGPPQPSGSTRDTGNALWCKTQDAGLVGQASLRVCVPSGDARCKRPHTARPISMADPGTGVDSAASWARCDITTPACVTASHMLMNESALCIQ